MRALAAAAGIVCVCLLAVVVARAYRGIARFQSEEPVVSKATTEVPAAPKPRPVPKAVPRPPKPPEPPPAKDEHPVLASWHKARAIRLELPAERRPLPEPLAQGRTEPGFKLRGIKGCAWTPEQYLAEIPVLAQYKMNFLMNCYLSLFEGRLNQWWLPLSAPKREGLERVVRACQQHGITFCFAMHPAFKSARPLRYGDPKDTEALWQHYAWMQGLGVQWFSVCFDDVPQETEAKGQAALVGELLGRLRANDPAAQMIVCPTVYAGSGGDRSDYLRTLGEELPQDAFVFWTGDGVFAPWVTRACAEKYRALVRRRLILWDNWCDEWTIISLAPLFGRGPELCEAVDGYMLNPHVVHNELNRVPLLTCADYAWNPWAYDPVRSLGQAVLHLGDTPEQRALLKDLVETYPGRFLLGDAGPSKHLLWGRDVPYHSPVIKRFYDTLAGEGPLTPAAEALWHVRGLADRLDAHFPGRFEPTRKVLRQQLEVMQAAYDERCGCWPEGKPVPLPDK